MSETQTETTENTEKVDPVEQSAIFINLAHKQFKILAYGMANKKKRSMARILEAILFEPLEEVELYGQAEKELLDVCREILYHKGVVMNYSFQQIENKTKGETNEQN